MGKTNGDYVAYELRSVDGQIAYAIDNSGDGIFFSPEEFERKKGLSLDQLDRSYEIGMLVYIKGHHLPFTVDRSVATADELARDEALADSDEAQEWLKIVEFARKNGLLETLADRLSD